MKYCMGCMREIEDNLDVCPHCGFNEKEYISKEYALPIHSKLREGRFEIGKVIGRGGFGVAYIALDTVLNIPVAVKEYYPHGTQTRDVSLEATEALSATAVADDYDDESYQEGKKRVLLEARNAAKVRTEGIVFVRDFFEENNTVFIVMDYVRGETLSKYIKSHILSSSEKIALLEPIFGALKRIHGQGIIHRDISPDNIMVDENGKAVLLDFGAARSYDKSTQHMTQILKMGYTPIEQLSTKAKQGPWTDIYALGATLYKIISGECPENSNDRQIVDETKDIKEIVNDISDNQSYAIMKAIAVKGEDRWQSIDEFWSALNDGTISKSGNPVASKTVSRRVILGIVAICSIVILSGIIALIANNNTRKKNDIVEETEKVTAESTVEEPVSVPNTAIEKNNQDEEITETYIDNIIDITSDSEFLEELYKDAKEKAENIEIIASKSEDKFSITKIDQLGVDFVTKLNSQSEAEMINMVSVANVIEITYENSDSSDSKVIYAFYPVAYKDLKINSQEEIICNFDNSFATDKVITGRIGDITASEEDMIDYSIPGYNSFDEYKEDFINPYKTDWVYDVTSNINSNTVWKYDQYEAPIRVNAEELYGTWFSENYNEVDNWSESYKITFSELGMVMIDGYRNHDIGEYYTEPGQVVIHMTECRFDDPMEGDTVLIPDYTYTGTLKIKDGYLDYVSGYNDNSNMPLGKYYKGH